MKRILSRELAGRSAAVIPIRAADSVASLTIAGRSVLDHTVRALRSVPNIGPIILALEAANADTCRAAIHEPERLGLLITGPHANRWLAIKAAVAMAGDADHIVVHQPERPLISAAGLSHMLQQAVGYPVVVGTLPVHSSIKRVTGSRIVATVPRNELHAAQSPWIFARAVLEEALRVAVELALPASYEMDLVRQSGLPVHFAAGELYNVPILSGADARFAELALARHFVAASPLIPPASPVSSIGA